MGQCDGRTLYASGPRARSPRNSSSSRNRASNRALDPQLRHSHRSARPDHDRSRARPSAAIILRQGGLDLTFGLQ